MTSAAAVPQESSHRDELLMQQSLLFSETLKDLKSLRKQLYSAAEYFEITYNKEAQKQIVEDTLKDYAIKALVNTVDHLGSVAYKVNDFLDDKMGEIFGTDLRLSCLEQRLQTYREFVNLGGLSQQSLVLEAVKHNKRYIFPVEQTPNDVAETRLKSNPTRICAGLDSQQFKNIGIQAIATETGSESIRDGFYELRSPQHLPRKSPKLFTSISMNQRQENRSTSPRRFPLPRSGSLMQRSSSPSHSNSRKRWPSEPRRTVSLSTSVAEREKVKDMEQYSSKSKRLFKAMLSLRKSKKDVTVYKYSDEN
ncbi:protein ABIL3-like isoform X1 [Hibiscus syriacus]|uniref:protein ABIL3-like isoform X1 n=1 Tax=Hibiscus syriacus TaxID=106335 RepID=UPI0019233AC0|nr:protein ABIL3-like isoform X1 [Hibiscus syriacus]XP_039022691.1 protein ABIL3-like isoform X1 [Hibiscus syriacus]XP_039022693.1 protein ABIL3-like isoform X1 [Hibiscus syriacus]